MNPKGRVLLALEKEPTGRVPVFMWYHPQTTQTLAKLLEIPPEYVPMAMGDDIGQE